MSLTSAGGLCIWDVGPCGHWHHRGPANRWRPLQHQDDSPQEEEQLQTPEEEGQTARGQYPTCIYHLFCVSPVPDDHSTSNWSCVYLMCVSNVLSYALNLFFSPQQPREPGTSRQDQAMLLADSSEDEF